MADAFVTVLVISGDEITRRSCERVLPSGNYRLELAGNATEAVNRLRKGPVDIVLVDLGMTGGLGPELLKNLRENRPDTDLLVISGVGTLHLAVEALRRGAYDLIEKPFSPEQLLNMVSRCAERRRLLAENIRLRQERHALYRIESLIGASPAMKRVVQLITAVAPTESAVLLSGERGTGRKLTARVIHNLSPLREGPFLVVDCGTTSDERLEAEVFGVARGPYGNAEEAKPGTLELAAQGSVLFEEIGSLGLALQAKLMRTLQEREFRPVGGRNAIRMEARILASTSRDLPAMVRDGAFREDLFYRINVFPISLAPLRERKEDIPSLAAHFLGRYASASGRPAPSLSKAAMKRLILHNWPANVRELENVIHRALILSNGKTVRPEHILITGSPVEDLPKTSSELVRRKRELRERSVRELERAFATAALQRADWNVTRAAIDVGMQRTNLQALLRKHGIKRRQGRPADAGD